MVGEIAAAHFNEGADDVADHVFEEAVAADGVDEEVALAFEVGIEDAADFGLAGAFFVFGGEGGEVMAAFEDFGAFEHPGLIEGVGVVVDVAPVEG